MSGSARIDNPGESALLGEGIAMTDTAGFDSYAYCTRRRLAQGLFNQSEASTSSVNAHNFHIGQSTTYGTKVCWLNPTATSIFMEPASYERYVRRPSITRLRAENCRTTVAMRVQQRPASCNGERYGLGGAAGTEEI